MRADPARLAGVHAGQPVHGAHGERDGVELEHTRAIRYAAKAIQPDAAKQQFYEAREDRRTENSAAIVK